MENGFEATSQSADAGSSAGSGASDKGRGGVADQLKTYGVDTDQMTEAATERVSELQQLIIDEIRARPKRAIGWAAAAGVVFAADVSLRRRGRKLHHCRITACRSPPLSVGLAHYLKERPRSVTTYSSPFSNPRSELLCHGKARGLLRLLSRGPWPQQRSSQAQSV